METNPFAVLSLIVAPAILTNATSVLIMSTSNRLARGVNRAREISKQLEATVDYSGDEPQRRLRELSATEQRALLIIRALRSFYVALVSDPLIVQGGSSRPGRHLVPCLFQPFPGQAKVWTKLPHQLPEVSRMIHLAHVTQFMDQNVSDQVWLDEQQLLVQTDCATARATAPTAFLATNRRSRECDACFMAQVSQPRNQYRKRLAVCPTLQDGMACRDILNGTANFQLSIPIVDQRNTPRSIRQNVEGPCPTHGRKVDFVRQRFDPIDNAALPRFRNLIECRSDPFMLFAKECLDQRSIESARNDDFKTPFNGDSKTHVFRLGTFAHMIIKVRPGHFRQLSDSV